QLAYARDGIAVVVVDGLEAELLRAFEPPPSAHDDAARGAERARTHRGQETHAARPDRHVHVARVDAGPLHGVQRYRGRVAARGPTPWKVPSTISASGPQIAIARTRASTSFDIGRGIGTASRTSNSWGAVSTSACIVAVCGDAAAPMTLTAGTLRRGRCSPRRL